MTHARWNTALAVGLLIVSIPVSRGQARDDAREVVATVSGADLTLSDLRGSEAGKLLQAEYQYYLTERKALDDLIDNKLLAEEARRRGMTLDELLNTVIYKDVKDPTDDQLEVYYEGLDTQDSFASVKSDILDHIREQRRTKARTAFEDQLRKDARISIALMPPEAQVDTSKAFVNGASDAPVVLVEFADYQCPYCQKVNPEIEKLKKEYGSSLTVIYKDFPLPMHSQSQKAAEASRCAGEQGKFWEYHNVLFYSKQLEVDALKEHARVLKLDGDKFDACLDSGAEADTVKADLAEAKSLGLTGTPSFFANGHFFSGVVDYDVLKQIIDQQLNFKKSQKLLAVKK
jgi:predicted DsbA family dithiol-disulfide isomerase